MLITVRLFSIAIMIAGTNVAFAQNYPTKPIRIVTSGIGGAGDFASRLIGQGISGPLGQPVIVENGAANLAGESVAKAAPDGYTLLTASSTFWFGPLLDKVAYDPVRDFSPISLVNKQPNILVVHAALPAKSVKELIALAKAKPGALNYAAGGAGSSPHLAAELFKAMAGVNIVRVYYKNPAVQMTDLIAGYIQLTFGNTAAVMPHVKSGRLRALAVTSAEPSALTPGLPTVAASGVPGYESVSITGILAPAKTPETIIRKLNQEIVRVANTREAKEKFLSSGVETVGSSPEQLAATVNSDMTKMAKVIKDAGIKAD